MMRPSCFWSLWLCGIYYLPSCCLFVSPSPTYLYRCLTKSPPISALHALVALSILRASFYFLLRRPEIILWCRCTHQE
ncbi:hypothetical protein B9Z19DRAFT_1075017 [Tuber borchii]|uniref:Uncharacterized protein n=1 Tax=Tuber borchii TaxID=42251 RepID=A0A2T7A3S3_TUBBO|nr:hypothetical protein B9Z19DRAFT_1075017 [Tuber borchii]